MQVLLLRDAMQGQNNVLFQCISFVLTCSCEGTYVCQYQPFSNNWSRMLHTHAITMYNSLTEGTVTHMYVALVTVCSSLGNRL